MELGLNENRELRTPAGVVVPKTSGVGIKIDTDTPTYAWVDLLGAITYEDSTGPTRPNFDTYRGGLKQFRFSVNDQAWIEYHIPHDYSPGSDLFVHTHWSHTATDVASGGVTWGFEATYAKGHNQAAFHAPITTTVTQAASTVQYQHMIAETQLSAPSGAGGLLDSANLEPDGVILLRVYLSANNISVAEDPFLHFCDLHMQTTNVGTKQRAPDFYT